MLLLCRLKHEKKKTLFDMCSSFMYFVRKKKERDLVSYQIWTFLYLAISVLSLMHYISRGKCNYLEEANVMIRLMRLIELILLQANFFLTS